MAELPIKHIQWLFSFCMMDGMGSNEAVYMKIRVCKNSLVCFIKTKRKQMPLSIWCVSWICLAVHFIWTKRWLVWMLTVYCLAWTDFTKNNTKKSQLLFHKAHQFLVPKIALSLRLPKKDTASLDHVHNICYCLLSTVSYIIVYHCH